MGADPDLIYKHGMERKKQGRKKPTSPCATCIHYEKAMAGNIEYCHGLDCHKARGKGEG